MLRYSILTLILICVGISTYATTPTWWEESPVRTEPRASLREPCSPGNSQVFQDINNVRALLLINGDCWWDGENPQYIVPKPPDGEIGVSAIFSGAVWIGGFDEGGNLKLAAKTFGQSNGNTDFWPGPISLDTTTQADVVCNNWDRHFEILGTDIDNFRVDYEDALDAGSTIDVGSIPNSILGWPAHGNPYFEEIYGFELPNTSARLAGFFDNDGDGNYDPLQGDYPAIRVRGCEPKDYADQMYFWIYNDAGNVHTQTTGTDPMRMEVQVQSFAYVSADALNDMTFQSYKLVNRGTEPLDSTYFAMWVDPDLGCAFDDYTGCNVERSLAYIYNSDAIDGEVEGSCDCDGTPTYCNEIPVLGIDYFRGPLDEFGNELGMSSFTYYNNSGGNQGDPSAGIEYYNYISGSWKDGSPFTFGGTGYGGTEETDYAFPDDPDNLNGWSMVTADLATGDRRTLQASGPLRLLPGADNELIIGVVFVPDVPNHPQVDLTTFYFADDIAQATFNSCFDIPEGPDPPIVNFLEMDQRLIGTLTNNERDNNYLEKYREKDFFAADDSIFYLFEGYLLYQLREPNLGIDLNNPDDARLVFSSDVKNGIKTVYEWVPEANAPGLNPPFVYDLVPRVMGDDEGIKLSFELENDAFTNTPLVNNKQYYYTALAYGYNNYQDFDVRTGVGQQRQYIQGRRKRRIYTVVPRKITTVDLNAEYGDTPIVTRTDGEGTGGNFLRITEASEEAILAGTNDGKVVYQEGGSPIDIKVVNPFYIKEGEYELTIYDSDDADFRYDSWTITDPDGQQIDSYYRLDSIHEELLEDYGISVRIGQTLDAGDEDAENFGVIGEEIIYEDPVANPWLTTLPALEINSFFGYITPTDRDKPAETAFGALSLVPYRLTNPRPNPEADIPYIISPSWDTDDTNLRNVRNGGPKLNRMANINVVLTADKDQWSRCVIIETASSLYDDSSLGASTEGGATSFELRAAPSVGKEAGEDGKPRPDGAVDDEGRGVIGMGWFPGYAINVETGKRLNIFFGENSVFDCSQPTINALCENGVYSTEPTGRDMMFNPTWEVFANAPGLPLSPLALYAGGQHFIYVTNEEYDECNDIYNSLREGDIIDVAKKIQYTTIPVLNQGEELLSYADGLIPNKLDYKIRVQNPFLNELGMGMNDGDPTYLFTFSNATAEELSTDAQRDSLLDFINVVPNPYYAYSSYETDKIEGNVRISNLPAQANLTIYTLDGKFVREFKRDATGIPDSGIDRIQKLGQVDSYLEWDMKNFQNVPVGSGVYLMHVEIPGIGEKVLKWFCVAREFDPTGL